MKTPILGFLISCIVSIHCFGQNQHIDPSTGKYKFWLSGDRLYVNKGNIFDSLIGAYNIMVNYNSVSKMYEAPYIKGF